MASCCPDIIVILRTVSIAFGCPAAMGKILKAFGYRELTVNAAFRPAIYRQRPIRSYRIRSTGSFAHGLNGDPVSRIGRKPINPEASSCTFHREQTVRPDTFVRQQAIHFEPEKFRIIGFFPCHADIVSPDFFNTQIHRHRASRCQADFEIVKASRIRIP